MNIEHVVDDDETDPIDIAETIAELNKWYLDRLSDSDIAMKIAGEWRNYAVSLSTSLFENTLAVSCAFDFAFKKKYLTELRILEEAIHPVIVGKFFLRIEQGCITYRSEQIFSEEFPITSECVAHLIGWSVRIVDQFYPAFQTVGAGESAVKALKLCMDTSGSGRA